MGVSLDPYKKRSMIGGRALTLWFEVKEGKV